MGKLSKRKKQRQAAAAAAAAEAAAGRVQDAAGVAASLPVGAGNVDVVGSSDEEMDTAGDGAGEMESHAGAVRGAVDLEADVMGGVTPEELQTAIRVVTALGDNLAVFRTRIFKPLRRALQPIVEDMTVGAEAAAGGGKSERSRKRSRLGEDSQSLSGQRDAWELNINGIFSVYVVKPALIETSRRAGLQIFLFCSSRFATSATNFLTDAAKRVNSRLPSWISTRAENGLQPTFFAVTLRTPACLSPIS